MNSLERIRQQVRKQLSAVFQSAIDLVDGVFLSISHLINQEDQPVQFPEEEPFTVETESGTVRLEAIAFAAFRYCWFVYYYEGRDVISFAELGEKIYNDPMKPRSTIQNTVKRAQEVTSIGLEYFCSGEFIYIRYLSDKSQM